MALLLQSSDFEEEKDFEMVWMFLPAYAGLCTWFKKIYLKSNIGGGLGGGG